MGIGNYIANSPIISWSYVVYFSNFAAFFWHYYFCFKELFFYFSGKSSKELNFCRFQKATHVNFLSSPHGTAC